MTVPDDRAEPSDRPPPPRRRPTGELVRGDDGHRRCRWGAAPGERDYHDTEWGRPVVDDVRLYEKLCLEGFQSGLAWSTILAKRDNFRRAFAGFDPAVVADFGAADVARLLGDAGIVRHRGKIDATIANARATLSVQADHGSLAAFVWSFAPTARRPAPARLADVTPTTPESVALAKGLKREGFRFVGPTTAYAAMQSLGLVNDHLRGCWVRGACLAERQAATIPGRA